jgi:SAM-dependent methyltransferase
MNTNMAEIEKKLAPIEQWVSNEALAGIYSSVYWNDIEEEKKKEWWIADGDYKRCMDYLTRAGLLDEWAVVENYVSALPGTAKLKIADLAAGIGWASALFSKLGRIVEVHAIEISRHRLAELFPYAVDMFSGYPEKIKRYIGSFYELDLENESMDIVFMSQAFHHADQPLKLLTEIDRITRGGGVVILSGENYISKYSQVKRIIKTLIKQGRFCTNFYENFPPDDISGDHYYRLTDYYLFFRLLGYKVSHKIVGKTSVVLMAVKLQ